MLGKFAVGLRTLSASTRRTTLLATAKMSSQHILKSKYTMPELESDLVKKPLPYFVLDTFKGRENQVCQVDGSTGKSMTFAENSNLCFSFADSLKDMGIKKGDVVAVISPNHLHFFSVVMGTLLTEATISPVNPLYTEDELKHQLEITNAKIVVTHPLGLERVLNVVAGTDKKVILLDDMLPSTSEMLSKPGVIPLSSLMSDKPKQLKYEYKWSKDTFDPETVAVIPFSSGTTGKSKGVMLTHRNLIANVLQIIYCEAYTLKATPDHQPCLLTPLPFFHIYGFVVASIITQYQGTKLVMMPTFDFKVFLELIQKYRANRAYVVPPVILALAKSPLVEQYDVSSLQCLMSGAAPLGIEVQALCAKRLNCIVKQAWGMTELSPAATLIPDFEIDGSGHHNGTSGFLVPGTEAWIINPTTKESLPPTQEGELLIRGPQVMKGYYLNEQATKATIRPDGFMHTGDIAKFLPDGQLVITDRVKELIKYKGFQVPPAELEAVILSMDQVADAIVIPVPDEEADEIPRAYVVKKPTAPKEFGEQDVLDYVHARVAPYKKLRGGVIFTDAVPKSPSGKLLRRVQIEKDRAASKNKK